MPRGVKRQTEDVSADDPVSKKNRASDNLQKFEQMKKEAEENRRRVRDEYLREQEANKANEGNRTDGDSRRETISVPPPATARAPANRRKSTSSAEPKTKTPPKPKTTPVKKSPSKPTTDAPAAPATAPKSRKTPAKTPSKTPAEKKPAPKTTPKAKSSAGSTTSTSKKSEPRKKAPAPVAASTPVSTAHLSSEEDADACLENDADWCGEIYPSIALSDSFNAVGHLYAGFVAADNGHGIASAGFVSVWLAAIIGVLRFGVSEKLFAQANCDLADLAGFVGYPMIGMSYAHQYLEVDESTVLGIVGMLVVWEAMTRSFLEKNRENAKLLTNIIFFVGPVFAASHTLENPKILGALVSFVLAGIAITPHHHDRIMGIRCVDWFHYIIAATAVIFANELGKSA